MSGSLSDPGFIRRADEFRRIGSRAVRRAQDESRELGIPNTYLINDRTYFELPDGRLVLDDPYDRDTGRTASHYRAEVTRMVEKLYIDEAHDDEPRDTGD
jgi:hypothetical protein